MLYDLYVGSTETHYAHMHATTDVAIPEWLKDVSRDERVTVWDMWVIWEGTREDTTVYSLELPDDATAQRVAYALSVLTDNDAVLVTRAVEDKDEHPAFNSVRRFRVGRSDTLYIGNRTLHTDPTQGIAVGDTITTRYGVTGEVSRVGSIAGFMSLPNGSEVRWKRSEVVVDDAPGWAWIADVQGTHVAYLVNSDASVSSV